MIYIPHTHIFSHPKRLNTTPPFFDRRGFLYLNTINIVNVCPKRIVKTNNADVNCNRPSSKWTRSFRLFVYYYFICIYRSMASCVKQGDRWKHPGEDKSSHSFVQKRKTNKIKKKILFMSIINIMYSLFWIAERWVERNDFVWQDHRLYECSVMDILYFWHYIELRGSNTKNIWIHRWIETIDRFWGIETHFISMRIKILNMTVYISPV